MTPNESPAPDPDGMTPNDRPERPVEGDVLPEETQKDVWEISALARKKGLRFWDTEFEVITRRRMVELGTYVLPYRWAHWTFGREYARMQKLHDLGLVEILELVINTRPARAYLLDANSRDDNRMVIAHVFAHVDFFANNMWFERTPDNILREAHHHERRIRELQDLYGRDAVEAALDRALAIQWHVDFYRHYQAATPRVTHSGTTEPQEGPPEGMTPSDLEALSARHGPAPLKPPARIPGEHRDLLEFLVTHAPLDELEREVLALVREEILYFYPNALTKIMNEGWATYWHAELLREYLPFGAFDAFAVKHSHLMQSEGLNPYKLGFLIYEDIRRRGDAELGPGEGLKRIFEVRRYGDDVSFIRDHLTQEVVDAAGLYLYDEDPETGERTVTSTRVEDVKPQILAQMENLGKPYITVTSGDHEGTGDLLLKHHFDGRELDMEYAGDVLKEIHAFWKRPVHLDSHVGGKSVRLTFDGAKPRIVDLEGDKKSKSRTVTDADGTDTDTDPSRRNDAASKAPPSIEPAPGVDPGPPTMEEEGDDAVAEDSPGARDDRSAAALVPGQTRLPSPRDRGAARWRPSGIHHPDDAPRDDRDDRDDRNERNDRDDRDDRDDPSSSDSG